MLQAPSQILSEESNKLLLVVAYPVDFFRWPQHSWQPVGVLLDISHSVMVLMPRLTSRVWESVLLQLTVYDVMSGALLVRDWIVG